MSLGAGVFLSSLHSLFSVCDGAEQVFPSALTCFDFDFNYSLYLHGNAFCLALASDCLLSFVIIVSIVKAPCSCVVYTAYIVVVDHVINRFNQLIHENQLLYMFTEWLRTFYVHTVRCLCG